MVGRVVLRSVAASAIILLSVTSGSITDSDGHLSSVHAAELDPVETPDPEPSVPEPSEPAPVEPTEPPSPEPAPPAPVEVPSPVEAPESDVPDPAPVPALPPVPPSSTVTPTPTPSAPSSTPTPIPAVLVPVEEYPGPTGGGDRIAPYVVAVGAVALLIAVAAGAALHQVGKRRRRTPQIPRTSGLPVVMPKGLPVGERSLAPNQAEALLTEQRVDFTLPLALELSSAQERRSHDFRWPPAAES